MSAPSRGDEWQLRVSVAGKPGGGKTGVAQLLGNRAPRWDKTSHHLSACTAKTPVILNFYYMVWFLLKVL
jgi:hypothetical protein